MFYYLTTAATDHCSFQQHLCNHKFNTERLSKSFFFQAIRMLTFDPFTSCLAHCLQSFALPCTLHICIGICTFYLYILLSSGLEYSLSILKQDVGRVLVRKKDFSIILFYVILMKLKMKLILLCPYYHDLRLQLFNKRDEAGYTVHLLVCSNIKHFYLQTLEQAWAKRKTALYR